MAVSEGGWVATAPAAAPTVARETLAPERHRLVPVLVLMLLAATFLEVLTGSTPVPALAADPTGFLGLLALYGCGAVLVWEAMVRWKKGWLVVPPLGLAYAIVEEGVMMKTMTDAHLGGLFGVYGHWLGVNWIPFIAEGTAEGAFSIGLSLLLVSLLYPELRGRSLLPRWGLIPVGLTFALVVAIGFVRVGADPLSVVMPAILLVSAIAILLIVAAHRLPRGFLSTLARDPTPTVRPLAFFLAGLVLMAGIWAIFTLGPHLVPWAAASFALGVAVPIGVLLFLLRHGGWRRNERHQVAFGAGMVAAFVPADVALEFLAGDTGVLVFTAILLGLLVSLYRRWSTSALAQEARVPIPPAPAPATP